MIIQSPSSRWTDEIRVANREFQARVHSDQLPTARPAADRLVVTCMDPRVNLEAIGIAGFSTEGALGSRTRIVRTLGGIADDRSLLAAIHLPGVREIAVLMHTDCGACLAWNKADTIAGNLAANLSPAAKARLTRELGELVPEQLRRYLRAFHDPRDAVAAEVARIRRQPWLPAGAAVHGLVYELETGAVEIIIDGSRTVDQGVL